MVPTHHVFSAFACIELPGYDPDALLHFSHLAVWHNAWKTAGDAHSLNSGVSSSPFRPCLLPPPLSLSLCLIPLVHRLFQVSGIVCK